MQDTGKTNQNLKVKNNPKMTPQSVPEMTRFPLLILNQNLRIKDAIGAGIIAENQVRVVKIKLRVSMVKVLLILIVLKLKIGLLTTKNPSLLKVPKELPLSAVKKTLDNQ